MLLLVCKHSFPLAKTMVQRYILLIDSVKEFSLTKWMIMLLVALTLVLAGIAFAQGSASASLPEETTETSKGLASSGASTQVDDWIDQNLQELKEERATEQVNLTPLPSGYLAQDDAGLVDWGNGLLSFTVEEKLSSDSLSPARDHAMAVRRATLRARKMLMDTVVALPLDGSRTVGGTISPKGLESVRSLLQNSSFTQAEFLAEDGSNVVAVTATAELRGGLAELIMPVTDPFLGGVPDTVELTIGILVKPERDPKQVAYRTSMAELGGFTGLIVDARGTEAKSSLLPLVADPSGLTAYGPFQVSRENAAANGVVIYVKSSANSLVRSRAGKIPLKVKALAASGQNMADLVVSYEDAILIRSLFKNEDVKNHCRAVVILD